MNIADVTIMSVYLEERQKQRERSKSRWCSMIEELGLTENMI